MPTNKATHQSKKKGKTAARRVAKREFEAPLTSTVQTVLTRFFLPIVYRVHDLLARRPHRSFRRTRHRDYIRTLKLPGYWAFTGYVRRVFWQQKKIFLWLVLLYGILTALLMGLASQDTYTQLSEALRDTGGGIFQGSWGEIGKAGLLLGTGIMGSLNDEPTDLQRLYAILLALMAWLTTIWLLRAILADKYPKLRDGLYNASAPFLSTFLVSLVLIVQLLPIALAAIGFSAAAASGLLDGGVEAMLFWVVASLMTALSLYWITTTLIALVVVTLPGMYPMQAIKTAGDLVIGRRVRILLRLLWVMMINVVFWVVTMVPIILFDTWLKGLLPAIVWLPIVPVSLLVVESFVVVWTAGYIYLLYRKVVDDDAAPA